MTAEYETANRIKDAIVGANGHWEASVSTVRILGEDEDIKSTRDFRVYVETVNRHRRRSTIGFVAVGADGIKHRLVREVKALREVLSRAGIEI